jgi:hypothetical protein
MSTPYNDEMLIRLLAKHFFIFVAAFFILYVLNFIFARMIDLSRVILTLWGIAFTAHFIITLAAMGSLGKKNETLAQKILHEILI